MPEVPAAPTLSTAVATDAGRKLPHLRWIICGLLFVATTINYVDRQTVSVLNPILKKSIGWDDIGYAWVIFAFQLAYAIGFPIAGRWIDKLGVRAGMTWAVVLWSVAAIAHAFAGSTFGFAVARFFLGIAEAANFPGCIKAVAEWFPKRQRALATGIFNSGTNLGVVLTSSIVWLALQTSWQGAFIVTGVLGFLWLGAWLALYRPPQAHARLSDEERALILADNEPAPSAQKIPWTQLLRYRQTWAFALGKTFTDPVWWFYLTWLPDYLNRVRGLPPLKAGVVFAIPYLAASVGSIAGGWLPGHLMKRGWPAGKARLVAMMLYALGMPAAIWAVLTGNLIAAVALISVATSCHQAWSANLFTLTSDMFPKRAVGSVVGLGAMCGALGSMFMTLVAGGMLQWFGSYTPLFIAMGVMHV